MVPGMKVPGIFLCGDVAPCGAWTALDAFPPLTRWANEFRLLRRLCLEGFHFA